VLGGGEINLSFRRNFNTSEMEEWEDLESELEGVQLTEEEDTVKWLLTTHGQFTTTSLYRFCTFPGVKNQKREGMWQAHMPLKVKIFVGVLRNRIQTADNQGRKNWQGNKKCQLCGEEKMWIICFSDALLLFSCGLSCERG
jgi:hypothetical protein